MLRLAVTSLVALTALVGCSTSGLGGSASHDKRLSKFRIVDADYASLGYRRDWIGYPVLSPSETVEEIRVYDDLVIAREGGSIVTALETSTGNQRWFDELANPLTKFVGIERSGGHILVASEAELFFVDIESGTLRDRQPYESIVSTRPLLSGPLAVFGTGHGEILGHLTTQSVKLWGFLTSASIEGNLIRVGRAIGAVSQNGDVTFVDASSGSLMGVNRIFDGTTTDPVTDGVNMFVGSKDQSIYAFNPAGARLMWRYRTAYPIRNQPVVHQDTLYCSLQDEGLVAIDPSNGHVRWKASAVSGRVIGARQRRLVVWDGTTAFVVDPQRGDVLAQVELPDVTHLEMDREMDGNLYAVSSSGLVARFIPR